MAEKLQADKKGGFLDMLLNKNELPEVKVSLSPETLVQLGLTIVISVSIIILLSIVLKQVFK